MSQVNPLKPEEDAFGQMLWSCHSEGEAFEVIERDDGYVDAVPAKGYFAGYEAWRPMEQAAMAFVTGSVLDIGVGAGRHALHLQAKGFDVLGIDISPLAIQVCKKRGLRRAEVVPIEDVDFRPNSVNTILMLGNNFGLFGDRKKARALLRVFHEMTTESASIIAETRDPYRTDNPAHREYHEFNKSRGRMSGQLRIRHRFRKYVGRWIDYLMVSKAEMQQILRGTAWKAHEVLESSDAQYITIIKKTR